MPLAFESITHGTVAFGFFNIDSDMLLLNHCFFFADEFCRCVRELDNADGSAVFKSGIDGFFIENQEDIGDLMGAIHDIRFTGFIGDTYRRYPFPSNPADFKQKPDGFRTRDEFTEMILPYAHERRFEFRTDADSETVFIGEYAFSRHNFAQLVNYVWEGGYPRWLDGKRPAYVLAMRDS